MNIPALSTSNPARSIPLEYILKARSGGRVTSMSAGSKPSGKVHPHLVALLGALGIDTSALQDVGNVQ